MASLEDAFWIQLAGFVMILIGNLLYSDALLMPSIRKIREDFLKLNFFFHQSIVEQFWKIYWF